MPDQSSERPAPVRRRYVVDVPGDDPEARTRDRSPFVREWLRHARLRGETRRRVPPAAVEADGLVRHGSASADAETEGARTAYDVLLWDDRVVRDLDRSRWRGVGILLATMLHAIVDGSVLRFSRRTGKGASVAIVPFAAAVLTGLVGVGLPALVRLLLAGTTVDGAAPPVPVALPLTAGPRPHAPDIAPAR